MIDIRCGKCGSRIIDWHAWRVNDRIVITAQHCGMRHQFPIEISLTVVLPAGQPGPPQSFER